MKLLNALDFKDFTVTPDTPSIGRKKLYSKNDGFYYVNELGDEFKLASTDYVDITISGLSGIYIPLTDKGVANGVATLDGTGKLPVGQLPVSAMEWKGLWNTLTNTPLLVDGTGDAGDVYQAEVDGSVDFGSGIIDFKAGDWVIYNGTIWQKSINSNEVVSVNGKTGALSLGLPDILAFNSKTDNLDVTSNSLISTLSILDSFAAISFNGTIQNGSVKIDDIELNISHSDKIQITSPDINIDGTITSLSLYNDLVNNATTGLVGVDSTGKLFNTGVDYTAITGAIVFASDITVSLSGGKTLGKYTNGQTIPAAGKTAEEVINLIAIEDIAPTYVIPTMSLVDTAANIAEVGTSYTNTLTATFTQNDAGILTLLRIQKNGSDLLPNTSTSPNVKSDSGLYPNGVITYIAYSDYNAGIIKNYTPSGTPDARTPLVRSVNAPQAASTNFASNSVTLTGYYRYFYGPSATAPVDSADVRALPSSQLTVTGNVFTLNTGSVEKIFSVCIPATKNLVSVIDSSALNANITANYILTTFNVNDASGAPVAYKIYTMTNAVPYPTNHAHIITIS